MEIELVNLLKTKSCDPVVTLRVIGWDRDEWQDEQTAGLIRVCHRHRVKHLLLAYTELKVRTPYDMIEELGRMEGKCPFMPDLRSITVEGNGYSPVAEVMVFMMKSRVSKVTWILLSSFGDADIAHCTDILRRRGEYGTIADVPTLRNFMFYRQASANRGVAVRFRPDCDEYKEMVAKIRINRRAFLKCQKAIVVLIGLKKQRIDKTFSCLNHDMMRIVIDMVWETRGTKVWIK